jgi:Mn2+/Fe2+ NRAMP family transporter
MMILINKRKIMGVFVNKPSSNLIGWGAVIILVTMSAALLLVPVLGR